MAEKPTPIYDESKIKTLSSLEHIRLRTGMYIGRIGTGAHPDDGCYVLLKEVVDNAIDFAAAGNQVAVFFRDGLRLVVMQVAIADVAEADDSNAGKCFFQCGIGPRDELGNARYRHGNVVLDRQAFDLLRFGNVFTQAP